MTSDDHNRSEFDPQKKEGTCDFTKISSLKQDTAGVSKESVMHQGEFFGCWLARLARLACAADARTGAGSDSQLRLIC